MKDMNKIDNDPPFITSIQSSAGVLALTSVFTFIIPNLILDVHYSLVQTTLCKRNSK